MDLLRKYRVRNGKQTSAAWKAGDVLVREYTRDGVSVASTVKVPAPNPAAIGYRVYSPIEFDRALPDQVELEYHAMAMAGGDDAVIIRRWEKRAERAGVIDFNDPDNRQGLLWLQSKTSLTMAQATALAGGAL